MTSIPYRFAPRSSLAQAKAGHALPSDAQYVREKPPRKRGQTLEVDDTSDDRRDRLRKRNGVDRGACLNSLAGVRQILACWRFLFDREQLRHAKYRLSNRNCFFATSIPTNAPYSFKARLPVHEARHSKCSPRPSVAHNGGEPRIMAKFGLQCGHTVWHKSQPRSILGRMIIEGRDSLVISSLADSLVRGVESVGDRVSETLFEPVIRLGVTGLARSGKTVFITSLVANLLDRGRMTGLVAQQEGRITASYLQPQPDDTVPRFDFESHLSALTGPTQHWPDSTRVVSELRLSFKVQPAGLLSGLQGPRTMHLDIVDYPGEWLLDLSLLDKSYDAWSRDTLEHIINRPQAKAFLAKANAVSPDTLHDEPQAQDLACGFTAYLNDARAVGFYDCTPGRFLLPGDLAGSPVLTFAPLPVSGASRRRTLHREMERRYEAYKSQVVKPFFRDHFARIDRQIVLVDALGAIHKGPQAVEDMRRAMTDILSAFRPGRNAWLNRLLRGNRVERIMFAATKADHLHHLQHPRLTAIIKALTREARDRASFAGARTEALSLASLRTTTEQMRNHNGSELPCVRGILLENGKQAAFYPGELPEDPAHLLGPARNGAEGWLGDDYGYMAFAPAHLTLSPGDGPPHIRLDRAAQFLIGDRL